MSLNSVPGLHSLLVRIGQGDSLALAVLYEQMKERFIRTILARVGGLDRADAEAAYNRAMFKIWACASSYEGKSDVPDRSALGWISKTILNTARDHARTVRRLARYEQQETDMTNPDEDEPQAELSPMEQLADSDLAIEERTTDDPAALLESKVNWHAFLETLDPRERAIVLRLLDGATQSAIAAEMKISPARLSQLLRQMRERLRDLQSTPAGQ